MSPSSRRILSIPGVVPGNRNTGAQLAVDL